MKKFALLVLAASSAAVSAPAFAGCPWYDPNCALTLNGPSATALRLPAAPKVGVSAPASACPAWLPYCTVTANGPSATALRLSATPKAGAVVTGKTVRAVTLPSGARVALR
jgi:hypothetical protein